MPCECLSKTVLKVFNGIFLVCGLAYIGLAIYVLVDDDFEWAGKGYGYGCLAFGGFIVLLSLFGLCGTGNRCSIWIYTAFMTLILLAELIVFIVAVTQGSKLKEWLNNAWNDMDAEAVDEFMKKVECGLYNTGGNSTIVSCDEVDDVNPCFEDCYNQVESDFKSAGSVLSVITIAVAGVQGLLLFAACCLVCDDDYDEIKH